MNNPKTTIIGVLLIVSSVLKLILDYLQNGTVSATDANTLLILCAGFGHVMSKDGGK